MTVSTDDHVLAAEHSADWLELPATPVAPGLARRFVTKGLVVAESDHVDVDVAVLLTSELVANAVLYGAAPIRLQLHRQPGTVRIEVHDHGPPFSPPAEAACSLTDEGGRGMPLLDALATSWGIHSRRNIAGKTLWFELTGKQPDTPPEARPEPAGGRFEISGAHVRLVDPHLRNVPISP
jgi:anti-sigma regulatory factor (Ser/Thr protein kinase)